MWKLCSVPKLRDYLHVVTDYENRVLVSAVVDEFTRQIPLITHKFRKGSLKSFQIKSFSFKLEFCQYLLPLGAIDVYPFWILGDVCPDIPIRLPLDFAWVGFSFLAESSN